MMLNIKQVAECKSFKSAQAAKLSERHNFLNREIHTNL